MARRETEVSPDPRVPLEARVTLVSVELLDLSALLVLLESLDLKVPRDPRDLPGQQVRRETPV